VHEIRIVADSSELGLRDDHPELITNSGAEVAPVGPSDDAREAGQRFRHRLR
jgi:hypothetical protein